MHWLDALAPQHAVLIAALFATCGWLYSGRKARTLAKKQHTLNVILQATFNKEFRDAQAVVRPCLIAKQCPDIHHPANPEREAFRMVLNHYELLAAGIRNGDFDERMVRDTQRGSLIDAYEVCENVIFKMRDARRRQTVYEHLEWLHSRWEKSPPNPIVKFFEFFRGAPFSGKRNRPRA
ncbi:MAG: DUF4760 domain-containing protein [Brevundimonas sp.]|uniref:DUF4760 domain-containing protein n=1 Tax=Brevundimonas sp. TaxID=1871086 RepID=UPI0030015E75